MKNVPKRVLIAEPDPELMQVFAKYLSDRGLAVRTAGTEEECLRRVTEFHPDGLVIEPAEWGQGIVALITRKVPAAHVVVLSNCEFEPPAGHVSRQLVKPVTLHTLYEAINEAD